jgi:protein-disulfide isomerase
MKNENELRKEKAIRNSKIKKILYVVVPIALFGWAIWYSQGVKSENNAILPDILTIKSNDYKKGAPNGKVVLVEYLDFECEACGAFYPLLKQLQKDFPEDLTIVNRYFPLPGHKNGMTSALAVEASARQGKFYEMHDILFENQGSWGEKGLADPTMFIPFAQTIGLDIEKWKVDMNDPSVKQRVERDVKEGTILGNTGTPSFYLQGKKMEGVKNYDDLKMRIQTEIDKLK